jgi:DNA-binding transcriptional LysR family regulator
VFDLKDLRCFVAVYERRGFARAASELHTVQSAVSVRIRRLEALIGAYLFERAHRSIVVTDKGELLYRHAKRVLDNVRELERIVRDECAA